MVNFKMVFDIEKNNQVFLKMLEFQGNMYMHIRSFPVLFYNICKTGKES